VFLQRETLISLPASQRQLITLVLRKLLASSTFAIAGTLRKLVARLRVNLRELEEPQRHRDDEGHEEAADDVVDESDFETLSELEDEWPGDEEQDEEVADVVSPPLQIDLQQIQEELDELIRYSKLADGITVNAKGESLVPALETAFRQAAELGAERKAIIFTESRRTQSYLHDLLSEKGFEGQLVLMNGSNNDPASKEIYKQWLQRHEGQD
jgi:adenine-specific DNA-methyltransferase